MTHLWSWRARRERAAYLALEDGTTFRGHSVGAQRDVLGEVVFNTGMTGYQEILTDPSYSGQIVAMTYPEIGNTGANPEDVESRRVFLNGFVMHALNRPSNWRSTESLDDYLRRHDVPALAGLDTRALTVILRQAGTMKGFLSATGQVPVSEAVGRARAWEGLTNRDYASRVSVQQEYRWGEAAPGGEDPARAGRGVALPLELRPRNLPATDLRLVAYDFGVKWNILRRLRQEGFEIDVVPAHTPAEAVLSRTPDGVVLSNGPADPAALAYAVESIRALIGRVPIMGVCLGCQLLGLALGGRTFRLKFGHHGCNHPVRGLETGVVEITSQNHNFAVDRESVERAGVEITHINLNDQTVEGLQHPEKRLFAVQYHPEAAPGPHDAAHLFRRFRDLIRGA
jgi:carbamoyl-phosphate synthase small subunit